MSAKGRAAFHAANDVSRETSEHLDSYAALLQKWQARINLVGPSTVNEMWTRHFLDSAQLLTLVAKHRPGGLPARWMDLGAGAGFPGLVLAIMGAGPVDLVESDRRKCSFLRQVIMATGAPATVHAARIEELEPFPVDIITARALAPLDKLVAYAAPFCTEGSEMWFLKGKDAADELTCCQQYWTVDAEMFESVTDPDANIVRLRNVTHV